MKTSFVLAVFAAFCVADAACADVKLDLYQRCIATSRANDTSAECVALRTAWNAEIQQCMTHPTDAASKAAVHASAGKSSGYKARYLICTGGAKQKFGTTSGH